MVTQHYFGPQHIAARVKIPRRTVTRFLERTRKPGDYHCWHRLERPDFEAACARLLALKAAYPKQPLRGLRSTQ
jgi:hypothetical protein